VCLAIPLRPRSCSWALMRGRLSLCKGRVSPFLCMERVLECRPLASNFSVTVHGSNPSARALTVPEQMWPSPGRDGVVLCHRGPHATDQPQLCHVCDADQCGGGAPVLQDRKSKPPTWETMVVVSGPRSWRPHGAATAHGAAAVTRPLQHAAPQASCLAEHARPPAGGRPAANLNRAAVPRRTAPADAMPRARGASLRGAASRPTEPRRSPSTRPPEPSPGADVSAVRRVTAQMSQR
jgi:hypothetical protein